jgi:hypothetical protein
MVPVAARHLGQTWNSLCTPRVEWSHRFASRL